MPAAWILLFALLGLLTLESVLVSFQPHAANNSSVTQERAKMKEIVLESTLRRRGKLEVDRPRFHDLAEELAKDPLVGDRVNIYLAAKWLADEEFTDEDYDLMTSRTDEDQALYAVFDGEYQDQKDLSVLMKDLGLGHFEHQIVGAKAMADLGDTTWFDKVVPTSEVWALWIVLGLVLVALFLSPGVWAYYIYQRMNGRWRPHGGTMPNVTSAQADGLALRAFLSLVAMFLAVVLVAPLNSLIPTEILLALGMLLGFALIALLIRVPVRGHRIDVRRVVGDGRRSGLLAGWGFAGIWANLPILAVAFVITLSLKDVLPVPSHPASETLMQDQSPLTLIGIFLGASVMAPIVEEIIFRGLILGACLRVMPPVAAILLNGLAFAAIHPQGLAGIPPLMALGVMLAMLTYQTGSLVPAMVMHAVNNTVVLVLNVIIN